MVPRYENGKEQSQINLSVITKEGKYNKEVMVAQKCDLCAGRPHGPACVEVCPADALIIIKPKIMNDSIKNRRRSSVKLLKST